MLEQTFSMVKPDGVARGLAGEVIKRYENKGLKILALKLASVSKSQAEQLYAEHKGKPFYNGLVNFAVSAPAVLLVVSGNSAVSVVRKVIGKTQPRDAEPGSVRGDYGIGVPENVVHASDSVDSAKREIAIFFSEKEMLSYPRADEKYLGKE